MTNSIFLSASVPDRANNGFIAEGNNNRIRAAVVALITEFLGKYKIVWGGHPAITPMIWTAAEQKGIDYQEWAQLFQSEYFSREYPKENAEFENVTFTQEVEQDREKSLRFMREEMLQSDDFVGAFFIGGMKGLLDELEMVNEVLPHTPCFVMSSTGGASKSIRCDKYKNLYICNKINYYRTMEDCNNVMRELMRPT